jgi:hypothetical protein
MLALESLDLEMLCVLERCSCTWENAQRILIQGALEMLRSLIAYV